MKRLKMKKRTNKSTKNIFSVFGVLLIIASFSMLLSACGGFVSKEEKTKNLLSEKYNKEFEIKEIDNNGSFLNYFECLAYEKDNPSVLFRVTVDKTGNGFSDTLVQQSVCNKISENVLSNLSSLPYPCYVHTEAQGMQPYTNNADIDIQSYWDLDTGNKFDICIFASEANDTYSLYQSLNNILSVTPYLNTLSQSI